MMKSAKSISPANPPNHPAIARVEWVFVFSVGVIILAITSLPYGFAYVTSPPEKQFMGMMLDVPDHLQYFSWMRELSTANLAANKLTPEPNKPVFFNLLWWGLGRIGRLFGWEYPALFQLLRVLAVMLFFPLAYLFCARFFGDLWKRRVAFLTICLTSGLGWVLVLLKYTLTRGELLFPLDVFVAEGNTFLCILGYPHFIAALLYIFVFDLVLRGEAANRYAYAGFAGLFALFLGWQHAYDLIIVYGVLGAYGVLRIIRDRRIPKYLLVSGLMIVAISCWPAVYSVMLTSLDPLWKEVLAQFANAGVYTPNLLHLPILLGIAFILALITAVKDHPFRPAGQTNEALLISGWFWISFGLVYLPVDYQIHLINGWQVPIALLAVKGLFDWVVPFFQKKFHPPRPGWNFQVIVTVLFLLSISLTNIYLWAWRFLDLSRHDYPYYLYQDEIEAFKWIEAKGKGTDVVLSSLEIGQYIPALTGQQAFLAHWAQTVRYHDKVQMVERFYASQSDAAFRKRLIEDYAIRFIFYGPAERRIGGFDPSAVDYLERVFSTGLVEVYQVR